MSEGTWHLAPGTWHLAPGTWHLAPGTWHLAPGTWHLAPGTWHLAPGTWHLAPGTWQVPVRSSLADKCSPTVAALVIVDMVNDFVHPRGLTATRSGRSVEAGRSSIEPIRTLAVVARHAGVPVVHVQHSTSPDDASHSGPWVDARRRARYSALDICLDGTWGQQVVDELASEDGDIVVKKHRDSGFARTELDRVLGERGRETIVVCGVSTNVCVESTARQGFDLDYYVVIPEDACMLWDNRLHEAALETARHRYAVVCQTSDLISIWQDYRP